MGSETATRNKIMKFLESRQCHCQKHEDKFSSGIPDLSFASPATGREGWIEFKQLDKQPARNSTKIKLGLTNHQKNWIAQRGRITNRVWVIVQIADAYFLFGWREQIFLNKLTYNEMCDMAQWHGVSSKSEELWDLLK